MQACTAQAPPIQPAADTASTVYHRQFKAGERRQSDNISEVQPGELTTECESPGPGFDRSVDDDYKVGMCFCRRMDEQGVAGIIIRRS
jgi:hypothetical protein